MEDHLQLPLELAELLHATLGPLSDRLREENHPWAVLVARVLEAYRIGRDETMAAQYGIAILADLNLITLAVSEQVCKFVEEITDEETDFETWAQELRDGNETGGDHQ